MTPAELLRKAAEELEAQKNTDLILAISQPGGHAIQEARDGEHIDVTMAAISALGREYRDEEVRRLRAAAARLETGGNPLLFTTAPGER